MTINVKDGGQWKTVRQFFVKDNNIWTEVKQAFVKENGVWTEVYKPGPSLELRYQFEMYGGCGSPGRYGDQTAGAGGYTNFFLYPLTGKGEAVYFTVGSAGQGQSPGSGYASGGSGAGPGFTSRYGGGGGGSSRCYLSGGTLAVCGGGGGHGGGDSGDKGLGGAGASPNNLSVVGNDGGSHDGGLGPGGAGGGGGLGSVNGGDGGSGSAASPGGGGGGGGGNPAAAGSSPVESNTTRCGGGGGGGGGLATLDGQQGSYSMVFNTITRPGTYSGFDGKAIVTVQGRTKGTTDAWIKLDEIVYLPGNSTFDPASLPDYTGISTPRVLSPTEGQTVSTRTPTITSSTFITLFKGVTHKSSSWQISTTPNFSNIVWESLNNTTNLTSITVPSGILTDNTYYVRVLYTGSNSATSPYSQPVSFKAPVVTPVISFVTNTPPSINADAGGGGYTFSVVVTDTANNSGTNFTYQWFFNNTSVPDATNSTWRVDPFYWSDNGKTVYCKVIATNNLLSSNSNSQTTTLSVTRGSDRDVPDVTNAQMTNRFNPYDNVVSTPGNNSDWGDMTGVKMFSIPAGSGKVRFFTGSCNNPPVKGGTFLGMRKSNFPSGPNCSNGRGTKATLGVRVALKDLLSGFIQTWDDVNLEIGYVQSDASNNYDVNISDWNWEHQEDLNPNSSYEIWLQTRRSDVESCTCPNYDNCSNIGYVGGFAIKTTNCISMGYVPIQYRYDTRPTPTPPA